MQVIEITVAIYASLSWFFGGVCKSARVSVRRFESFPTTH